MEEQEEKLETQQLGILEKTLNDNGERLIELYAQIYMGTKNKKFEDDK